MIRLAACLLLTLVATRAAGEDTPSAAATAFLRQLREIPQTGDFDATQLTAMTPGTTRAKRTLIEANLRRLAAPMAGTDLSVEEEKTDGPLAAVIVSQTAGFEPDRVQVHAIALIRRDDTWLPAPVPGSFENLGITYLPDLAPRAGKLEAWMRERRAHHLEDIRRNLRSDFLARIRKSAPAAIYPEATPAELLDAFVDAWESRDFPATLACLGGLEDPLPGDWQDTLALVTSAWSRETPTYAYIPIARPGTVRHVFDTHPEEADRRTHLVLGIFTPTAAHKGLDALRVLDFTFATSPAGRPRLLLPDWLITNSPRARGADPTPAEADAFARSLLKSTESTPADSPEALADQFFGHLSGFPALLALSASENANFASLIQLAAPFALFAIDDRLPTRLDLAPLDDTHSLLAWQPIDAAKPEIDPTRIGFLTLLKTDAGWLVDPAPNPSLADARRREILTVPPKSWPARLGLAATPDPLLPAPAETEVRTTAEFWIAALTDRDLPAITSHAAAFPDDEGTEAFTRYLGGELPSGCSLSLLGIHRTDHWAAASIRHQPSEAKDPPTFLLHPIIATPQGPRVMAEAILYNPDSRPRRFLNDRVWNRLAKKLPAATVDELRTLLEAHQALSAKP